MQQACPGGHYAGVRSTKPSRCIWHRTSGNGTSCALVNPTGVDRGRSGRNIRGHRERSGSTVCVPVNRGDAGPSRFGR